MDQNDDYYIEWLDCETNVASQVWYVVGSCTGMKDSQILEADLSIDRVATWRYSNSRKWQLDVRVIIVEKTRFYPQARMKWETKTSSRRREKSARVASSWFRDFPPLTDEVTATIL